MLDILHRCLTAWLAPALPFTAEESWTSRFGDAGSVHLTLFPEIPAAWRDEALAQTWAVIRAERSEIAFAIEQLRQGKKIGSSLQAEARIAPEKSGLLGSLADWADICITSRAVVGAVHGAAVAEGTKCERCWRVLQEVGAIPAHPTLCVRCCEAVEA